MSGFRGYPRLPMPEAAVYDVDVAVIGGGPAGLAAAIRCRWIKSFHAVPCSVAVFEAGRPGGLATWRTCSLTGPGYRYRGDGLAEKLMVDIERFRIPIIGERVDRLTYSTAPGPARFEVTGSGGTRLRSGAVILASGSRSLANEAEFIGRGLFITYMGYEYFPEILDRAVLAAGGRGLLIAGNGHSAALAEMVHRRADDAGGVTWVLDEPAEPTAEIGGRIVEGRVARIKGQGDPSAGFDAGSESDPTRPDYERPAEQGLTGVEVVRPDGSRETHDCGAVFLDYNAWELAPSTEWLHLPVERNPGGTVSVDRWCATSEPGVFAAGDVTGRYASTAMALGDGVNAGFGAFRAVHRAKFGDEPRLFAYAPTPGPVVEGDADMPEFTPELIPVPLAPVAILAAGPSKSGLGSDERAALWTACDGAASIASIAEGLGLAPELVVAEVHRAASEKDATVHPAKSRIQDP